ncbi:PREDICTED: uncharacterized protein LOC108363932 [Rhagoletis zephyria]|uniref:uncharacterized protein LOC108363932 n=1 Tax=Rhagoletis zephyria TaxID=28612 RepID=UPI000811A761|nr:PREDICTED: uncharacterized protein LOC108363932 [Rhagoletis zephyria]
MFRIRAAVIFVGVIVLNAFISSTASAIPAPLTTAYEEPVRRLHKANKFCAKEISLPLAEDMDNEHIAGAYIRCMATNMGLWNDGGGYNAKRVAKFFIKQRNENEVMTVVEYCNQQYQQTDVDLWAFQAYRCATAGRMGTWLGEYMLSAKL